MPPRSAERAGESAAIRELLAALNSNTALLGASHPQTLALASRLAIVYWCAGDISRAVGLLDQALDLLTSSLGAEHPLRVDALSTLGEIMLEQRHLDQACAIQREVLECRVRHGGRNHPDSLAAKGDLAAILFELGHAEEAVRMEREAFESARAHLGKAHSVTYVLAWNRALSCERSGDPAAASRIIADELAWLLAEDPSALEADGATIRALLSERLDWDCARSC